MTSYVKAVLERQKKKKKKLKASCRQMSHLKTMSLKALNQISERTRFDRRFATALELEKER